MWEPGLGGCWGRLLTGCWGDDARAPASAAWLGGVGCVRYRGSQIFVRGGLACAELPRGVEFGALWSHFFSPHPKGEAKKNWRRA